MNAVETAIASRLSGTTAITSLLAKTAAIHNLRPPAAAVFPLVIYGLQAGSDDNDNPHRARHLLYLLKAVSVGSPYGGEAVADAGTIDAAIDAAFHKVPLTVTGWTNIWLVRETDIRYIEELPNNRQFFHAGGVYRIRLAS